MLTDKAMKGIGYYAKTLTESERFGVGSPNIVQAMDLLLFSYALSHSSNLTEEEIKDIDTRISDIRL